MANYMFYEAFTSQGFTVAVNVLVTMGLVLCVVFFWMHMYAIIYNPTSRRRMLDSVKLLNRETSIYYAFNLLTLPVGIIVLQFDPDSSLGVCNALYRTSAPFVYMSNFLLYRLLIVKSTLYDPMSQMRRLTTVTYWVIHGFYLPLLFYGIGATWIWSREFVEVEGNTHCVERHSFITPIFFLALDTTISISCLIILAAPTLLVKTDRSVRCVVIRNSVTIYAAVASTFLFLLYSANASSNEGPGEQDFFIISITIKLGSLDHMINFTAVCFSWPLSFYKKILKDNVTAIASRAGQIISHLTAEKSNTHGSPHIASIDVDAAKQSLQNGSLDVRPSQSDSSPTAKGRRPTLSASAASTSSRSAHAKRQSTSSRSGIASNSPAGSPYGEQKLLDFQKNTAGSPRMGVNRRTSSHDAKASTPPASNYPTIRRMGTPHPPPGFDELSLRSSATLMTQQTGSVRQAAQNNAPSAHKK